MARPDAILASGEWRYLLLDHWLIMGALLLFAANPILKVARIPASGREWPAPNVWAFMRTCGVVMAVRVLARPPLEPQTGPNIVPIAAWSVAIALAACLIFLPGPLRSWMAQGLGGAR